MSKLKKPDSREDAVLNAAIETDLDTFEASSEQFATARRGRPRLDNPKQAVSIRLDREVVEHFKASGKGWQSRLNAILRQHIQSQD